MGAVKVVGAGIAVFVLCVLAQARGELSGIEFAPGTESEKGFLAEAGDSTSGPDWRRVEYAGSYTYKLDLPDDVEKAELWLDLDHEFIVSVGPEPGKLEEKANSGNVNCEGPRVGVLIDLDGFLAASKTNEIYLRISDADPGDGCGSNLRRVAIRPAAPVTLPLHFTPDDASAVEDAYLFLDAASNEGGTGWRAADSGGFWIYRFNIPPGADECDMTLSLANNFKVSISTDNATYAEVANSGPEENCTGEYVSKAIALDPYLKTSRRVFVKFERPGKPGQCGANLNHLGIEER